MLKGFKEFIMRGNVVDLAIAVVIGTAFAAVVSTFVSAIVKPVISAFPGGSSAGLGVYLRHKNGAGVQSTFIDFSAIINAIIVFLITAAVVYFIFVLPMNKFQELRAKRMAEGKDPDPDVDVVPSEDVILLREIRDLLATTNTPSGAHASGTEGPATTTS
jgi:large conductance mechanosensitive channel